MKDKIKTQVLLTAHPNHNTTNLRATKDPEKGAKTVKPFLSIQLWISWSFLWAFPCDSASCSFFSKNNRGKK